MVAKFTFQSVFSNSRRNLRRFSARGREESLEPYSILWSDWPTSKRKVWRHGNRFAARVCRRYFSEGEKRRPEMHLLVAGYRFSRLLKFFRKIILLSYPVETEIVVDRKDFSDESLLLGNIMRSLFPIQTLTLRLGHLRKINILCYYHISLLSSSFSSTIISIIILLFISGPFSSNTTVNFYWKQVLRDPIARQV